MKSDVKCELDSRKKNNIHIDPAPVRDDSKFDYCKNEKKRLVGILNCTPDSFHDGAFYNTLEKAVAHGEKLFEQGADIIDIGGEASNPHSTPICAKEEYRRIIPVIKALPYPISIDSYKPEIVEAAIEAGAIMINDITGCTNPAMRSIVRSSGLPVCVMHMSGTPQTMQKNPHYPNGVVAEIKAWFLSQIDLMVSEGIDPKQIILDPGIGFGKSVSHNIEILNGLEQFAKLGFPLYVGLSRKSFIQKILGKSSQEILPATLALDTICLLRGVNYLRVHDVKEHRDILTMMEHL